MNQEYINRKINPLVKYLKNIPISDIEFYSLFLSQTYYFTKHSSKLLVLSSEYIKNDEVKNSYMHHAKEEGGHQNLAASDLSTLCGKKPQEFSELESTRNLYNKIYDNYKNEPFAILGYAMALEFLAVDACPFLSSKVTKEFGSGVSTFLDEHGELDIEHTQGALKLCQSLKPDEIDEVRKYFNSTIDDYREMVEEMESSYNRIHKAA